MKKTIIALAALSLTVFAGGFGTNSSQPDQYLTGSDQQKYQYVICTASETGSYYQAGKRLVSLLGQERGTSHNTAVAETTDGTKQNLQLVADGICNVAFVQEDYLAFLRGQDKAFFDNKAIITLERTENVQLIMRKGMSEDDIQEKGAKVLVGLANSGGAASWQLIQSLEPDYKLATTVYGDIDISALSDLAAGRVDAIIKTAHLNPSSDQLAKDVQATDGIEYVDFDDSDLNDSIDFGDGAKPIYRFVDTTVAKGFFDTEAETFETHVAIIVDKSKMSKKQKNRILRVLTLNKSNLF